MSCCPGPKHGREFDCDREAPSDVDMDRFGGDDDDQWSDYDDEAFDEGEGRWDGARSKKTLIAVGAGLAAAAIALWFVT
ncbi:MAG: hypothetical protein IBJ10_01605 [Phycisphaerales bacterium]|nr:hypothetical protein [Phycisphaerales bacterium]